MGDRSARCSGVREGKPGGRFVGGPSDGIDVHEERDCGGIGRGFWKKHVHNTERQTRGMKFVRGLVEQDLEIGSVRSGDAKGEQYEEAASAYQRTGGGVTPNSIEEGRRNSFDAVRTCIAWGEFHARDGPVGYCHRS